MLQGVKRPAEQDGQSESASVNSRTVQLPLPEGVDANEIVDIVESEDLSLFGNDDKSEWDGYVEFPPQPPALPNEKAEVLDDSSAKNLRAMVADSCMSAKPIFKFKMPWERKGMSLIFNKDPSKLIPTPVMSPIEFDALGNQSASSVQWTQCKTSRGAYSDVINFRNIELSEKELEETAMTKALEKWYMIFSTGPEAWPTGFDLHAAVHNHRLEDMKLVFGNRSHGTLLRRGSSILQFTKWYRSRYFALCPFPVSRDLVEEYLQAMMKDGKPASYLRGFVEALNFCKHVVGITVSFETEDLISAKIRRLIEVSDAMRPEKNQARVLTVREVEHLEFYLSDERLGLFDRFASGCMLFCLYSRSRWSDIRKIYNFIADVDEREGKISGYLECKTRSHKTSRLVAKGGLAMPLVAPIWGVTSPPWGLAFLKVAQLVNRPVENIDQEPLLTAPNLSGGWSGRAVTTKEAGKWIRNLLKSLEGGVEFTTIHTLKATPLSWCAKWGLEPDVRAILGHHSTGKTSAECYARDSLAKPLRDFELVLQQVRTKAFSPDSTRSGMMSSAIVPDPKCSFTVDPTPGPEASEVSPNSGDSSSDSQSSDDSSDHEPEAEQQNDPIAAPRAWDPDVVMYRNIRTQVVHVSAVGGSEVFSCGVRITPDFEQVDESPFLDFRKCKRCAASKPIRTVGQMAAGLKKWRTEREKKAAPSTCWESNMRTGTCQQCGKHNERSLQSFMIVRNHVDRL